MRYAPYLDKSGIPSWEPGPGNTPVTGVISPDGMFLHTNDGFRYPLTIPLADLIPHLYGGYLTKTVWRALDGRGEVSLVWNRPEDTTPYMRLQDVPVGSTIEYDGQPFQYGGYGYPLSLLTAVPLAGWLTGGEVVNGCFVPWGNPGYVIADYNVHYATSNIYVSLSTERISSRTFVVPVSCANQPLSLTHRQVSQPGAIHRIGHVREKDGILYYRELADWKLVNGSLVRRPMPQTTTPAYLETSLTIGNVTFRQTWG